MSHLKRFLLIFLCPIGSLSAMQDTIQFDIEGALFPLTMQHIQQSKTLLNLVHENSNSKKAIVVPQLNKKVFDYIYKDMTGAAYDETVLNNELLEKLIEAATYLNDRNLINKYTEIHSKLPSEHKKKKRKLDSPVTLKVGESFYTLQRNQAEQSRTLAHMLEDAEDTSEALPLPESLEDAFSYIFKDLTNQDYDPMSLDFETMLALLNAANYLDIPDLLTKYTNNIIQKITTNLTQENVTFYIQTIDTYLPAEMQQRPGNALKALNRDLFKTLFLLKIMLESTRSKKAIQFKLSPDKKYIYAHTLTGVALFSIKTNKQLWAKRMLGNVSSTFSSDSSKILLVQGNKLQMCDTVNGKLLHEFIIEDGEWIKKGTLKPKLFLSDVNKILIKNSRPEFPSRLLIVDADTGDIINILERYNTVSKMYYNSQANSLGLLFFDNELKVIDINTGQTIKIHKVSNESKSFFSLDGKKILTVSRKSLLIENSFNDDEQFSIQFETELSTLPEINFSADNKLLSVTDNKSNQLHIFNFETGELIWTIKNIFIKGVRRFSVNFLSSSLLALDQTVATGQTNNLLITLFDIEQKKELWTKKKYGSKTSLPPCIIAFEDFVFVLYREPFTVEAYDLYTGKTIAQTDRLGTNAQFQHVFISDDFLYVMTSSQRSRFNARFICLDVSTLAASSIIRNDMSYGQALVLYFVLDSINKKHDIIIDDTVIKELYESIPHLKSLNQNHNQKNISFWAKWFGS